VAIAWLASLIIPWVFAAALALWPAALDRHAGRLALLGATLTAMCVSASSLLAPPTSALATLADLAWLPALGLELHWVRDGLSAMFATLTAWIAAMVTLFATAYMPHAQAEAGSDRREAVFYALLSAFTGAMLGLVSAGNLLQFYLFWELTGLASFLLIGFWHHHEAARLGASRSFVLTTLGGVAMLVGLLMLGTATGTWDFQGLLAGRAAWRDAPWAGACAGLLLTGALAKSAQFPFMGWLPGAMAAPTPVSAFLHSSALVAAGVYLVARFFPFFSHTDTWHAMLIGSSLVGVLVGGVFALRQEALKAMLAYSTISQYAFILLGFGLGSAAGAQAGVYAFFVHAILKAALFLVAGAVAHVSGQTAFADVGGLVRSNPYLAALAAAVGLSLGGVPILGGFYYKEELLNAAYQQGAWVLLAAMLLGGMLTLLYMLRFLVEVFLDPRTPRQTPHRLPRRMGAAITVLAFAALAAGVFPGWINAHVLDPAIGSVMQRPVTFTVEWHLSLVFLLSLAVLAFGAGLGAAWRHQRVPRDIILRLPLRFSLGGDRLVRAYDALSDRLLSLHDGNLRRYLRLELTAAIGLFALAWGTIGWVLPAPVGAIDWALALMLLVSLMAAAGTLWLHHHVMAVIALTISGYALAAVFALMHGPDVALAQVLVETLATFSIVLALRQTRLIDPQHTTMVSAGKHDWGRWAIALGVGGGVGWGTFWSIGHGPADSVGAWYAREGYAETGMADLVTAILTDFRALDTAIEILVFVSAALAVVALFRRHPDAAEAPPGGRYE
jgi:multicomponent K+:H+ antiporter subunit A